MERKKSRRTGCPEREKCSLDCLEREVCSVCGNQLCFKDEDGRCCFQKTCFLCLLTGGRNRRAGAGIFDSERR